MPKFDYDKMFALAQKLLEKFGGSGSVEVTNMTTPDPTKQWERTNTPLVSDVTMCIVPMKRVFDRGLNFGISAPNDVTRATHTALVLWSGEFDLVPDSKLIYQGKTWLAASATPIRPFDTGVIWKVDVWGQA